MAVAPTPQDKTCQRCGRRIEWRRAWSRDWDSVRYCSQRCRRTRLTPIDGQLEEAIMSLLLSRPRNATICPSEAARMVAGDDEQEWRSLMEPARSAARRLVAQQRVDIVQGGRRVDPSTARGPIRIRLAT
jgi:hypothetical protein